MYVDAIRKIAKTRKLLLVDLFTNAKGGLTDNGLHVKDEAQGYIAQEVTRQLGVETGGNVGADLPMTSDLKRLRLAVVEKHRLRSG